MSAEAGGGHDPNAYQGPIRELDENIVRLVEDPDSLSDQERQDALHQAAVEAGWDAFQNKVVIEAGDGQKYWGAEYPNAFSFNGQLRGPHEKIHKDFDKRSTGQQLQGPDARFTHVIFETSDGHMYCFRRTGDRKSAAFQTFEVSSTTKAMGQEDGPIPRSEVDTQQLKDVVAIPGHPLVLGKDPQTGKQLRTRGEVTRITTINKQPSGAVAPNHPALRNPDQQRDTAAEFMEAMRQAREMDVASQVGPLAAEAA